MDIVAQHRRQEPVAELFHQLLCGDFADGRDALEGFEHGRGVVAADQQVACNERRLPVEPHPHPDTPQDEELLARGLYTQLLAQLDELDQGVGAVEHPDLGARHRLLDLTPPLVDKVRRRKNQGAAVAFGIEHGGRGDADGRLAAAHLAIDDHGAFALVNQQLCGGMDDLGLGREQLALQAGDDELPVRPRLAVIDRRVGMVKGVEQFVAELADEVLKAQGKRRFRFGQIALDGNF